MSGDDSDLIDLLGPEPADLDSEADLVDEAPPVRRSRPMGEASRGVLERSRSYPINAAARARLPDRLRRLLKNIADVPVASDAARRAGISLSQLKYMLQRSKEGRVGDGYDVALPESEENGTPDNTERFHLAWDEAMNEGLGKAEKAAWALGVGYREIQAHKGRVQYQIDPDKYALFVLLGDAIDERNPALWLRDEFGAPVPETIFKQDPDMLRWILENRKPKDYGRRAVVDMNVTGGVLVVGMKAATSEALNELEEAYRKEGRPAVTFEEDEGD